MAFDGNVLRPILKEMAERRQRLEKEAEERKKEIYNKIPRIREIDIELRTTPLEIVRASFTQKKDAAPQLRAVREHNLALQKERAELLVAAGHPYDYMEPQYDCQHCKDTGYLSPGEPCECLKNAYREAQKKALTKSLAVGSESFGAFRPELYSKERIGGVPSPYEQMCEIYDYCVEYTKHFGAQAENLYFSGGTGLGKTLLASCIALEIAQNGASVVYDTAFQTFAAFEERKFGRDTDVDCDPTEKYRTCDLLILDDVGSEMITAFTTAAFYNLINVRLLSGKKTILISTFSVDEIAKKYNAQIASRIRGDFVWLAFCGQDIRSQKRKQ